MSRTITITLPDYLVEHLEILAGIQQKTLEETVLAQLDYVALPTDDVAAIKAQLALITQFSDKQLWAVVDRRLTPIQTTQLENFNDRIKASKPLSPEEDLQYQQLLDLVEVYMLWRSAALVHLKERGYDVREFFQGSAE